ncbi:helix-turn-helix transcriptional regulator [Saccharothrix longispora]|uniref:helix-turn-helix domain-containing protein n=2 Tax=Saccharothrix longispora TaxID=33920 RepID=UPI0031EC46E6
MRVLTKIPTPYILLRKSIPLRGEMLEQEEKVPTRLSTARSRELGEELRRVRHRSRMSSAQVAEALGWSLGKLSKLETGSRGTSPWEIGTLLGRCGADKATRDRVLAIAVEADTGNFVRRNTPSADTLLALTLHENAARTVMAYEPLTVPSLAQTEDYATVLTGDRSVARARAARQDNLRRPTGPETVIFVHEAALRLVVGGTKVMRDQMLRLTLMCGWSNFSLLVVPMAANSHGALRNPATLLTFASPTKPLAYTETDSATVFHDDPAVITEYEAKMRALNHLVLSAEQSREVFARWADAYDKRGR